MEQNEQKPVSSEAKAAYFRDLAKKHWQEMRLLFRGGKLTKREGWRNVANHQVTTLATADVLGDLLKLSPEERQEEETVSAVHDSRKRLEIRPQDFTQSDKARIEELTNRVNPNPDLMAATGPAFLRRALVEGKSTFLERLQFYVDDICMGDQIVPFAVRIAEVEKRIPNPDTSGTFPTNYWEKERELCLKTQEEIYQRLKDQGVDIESASDIPFLIRREIAKRMQNQKVKESEHFTMRFPVSDVLDERRGSPNKNEDSRFVYQDEETIQAAVFDGATAIEEIQYFKNIGKTPGRIAAEIASEKLQNLSEIIDPTEALVAINNALREEANAIPIDEVQKSELFSTVGLIVRIDKKQGIMHFSNIGDCSLITRDKDRKFTWHTVNVAERFEQTEIAVAQRLHDQGLAIKDALSRPQVQSTIAQHRRLENDPQAKGYGSLKGSPDSQIKLYIQPGKVSINPGDKIFLLTDGMLAPAVDEESQKKIVENALNDGGIMSLIIKTRTIQENDPELTIPRLKQFDDAAAIEITVPNK